MNIRRERPQDYRQVENLTREAFWNVYRPGCTEHYLLNRFRENPDFIPELDFVMEEEGRIIGHVMYSKAEITCENGSRLPAGTLGPISIHPDYQRKGYGLKLLLHSLDEARRLGLGLLCIEGNLDFYGHAGFVAAGTLHLRYPGEPEETGHHPHFLARELTPGYLKGMECTFRTPKGYFAADEDPEAFEAYDATFPPKEKKLQAGQLPQFCQSCGMPLTEAVAGSDADGSRNCEYCIYCYKDGAFTGNFTLEEMVEFCAQFVEEYNRESGRSLTKEEYKAMLRRYYPTLKRWRLAEERLPHADSPVKRRLIDEINALGIAGMPKIENLFVLQGSFVNLEYKHNGNAVKLLDDDNSYWGTQVEKCGSDGRCFGIACDERYILVSEYGENGADAQIVMLKRRDASGDAESRR
ncbi:MAG: GNAT family N-acetyltransferase [Rikenellaceae bacterium]|nr:GNAT family N-acetyltransferase [Rikenellaceae bacterium]